MQLTEQMIVLQSLHHKLLSHQIALLCQERKLGMLKTQTDKVDQRIAKKCCEAELGQGSGIVRGLYELEL